MSDVPVQLVVAAFQAENGADEALKELKQAKREKLIGIVDAAVIRRDQKDKIHIKETEDVGGGKGAVAGGLFGAAIGLLGGPVGLVLAGATGALVGGLAAKKIDMGISNDRLKELGDGLKPGTSAIVAIIEHKWVATLEQELAEAGADVMTQALKADISEQLEAGREVAFTAVGTGDAMAAERVVTGEDRVEVDDIVVTEDGVAGKATVVTEEGAVTKGFVVTDEGTAVGAAVVTDEGFAAEQIVATDEGAVVGVAYGTLAEPEEASPDEEAPTEDVTGDAFA
jgi:uncharacterized membrane protein